MEHVFPTVQNKKTLFYNQLIWVRQEVYVLASETDISQNGNIDSIDNNSAAVQRYLCRKPNCDVVDAFRLTEPIWGDGGKVPCY